MFKSKIYKPYSEISEDINLYLNSGSCGWLPQNTTVKKKYIQILIKKKNEYKIQKVKKNNYVKIFIGQYWNRIEFILSMCLGNFLNIHCIYFITDVSLHIIILLLILYTCYLKILKLLPYEERITSHILLSTCLYSK